MYNEEIRLGESLDVVGAFLQELVPDDHEIVISDDGSTDRSRAIAEERAQRWPVRIVGDGTNQGKGSAVTKGMVAATGDFIFFFDADLSTPIEEMRGFLEHLESDADVVIGTRKHPDAQIDRPQPWHRVHLGLAYTKLVHLLTGTQFSDYTCGFKAFRAHARDEVFPRLRLQGWSFDAEVMFLAHQRKLKTVEIPVRWVDEPDSRVRLFRAIFGSFVELLLIRVHQLLGHYR